MVWVFLCRFNFSQNHCLEDQLKVESNQRISPIGNGICTTLASLQKTSNHHKDVFVFPPPLISPLEKLG